VEIGDSGPEAKAATSRPTPKEKRGTEYLCWQGRAFNRRATEPKEMSKLEQSLTNQPSTSVPGKGRCPAFPSSLRLSLAPGFNRVFLKRRLFQPFQRFFSDLVRVHNPGEPGWALEHLPISRKSARLGLGVAARNVQTRVSSSAVD
jgi:hypothetical protein